MRDLDSYFSALISCQKVAASGLKVKRNLDFFYQSSGFSYILIYKVIKWEKNFEQVSLNDENPPVMEATSDLGDHLFSNTCDKRHFHRWKSATSWQIQVWAALWKKRLRGVLKCRG